MAHMGMEVMYHHINPHGFLNYIGSDCHMASNPDKPMCATDHVNGGCSANHGGQICSIYLH